jgi:hypothetical protein
MEITHSPQFDVDKVIEHYTKKDGVEITYVCTTDLKASDVPVDVFYRATPHPQFGNRYFGIFYDRISDHMMITDADIIETLSFGLVEGDDGKLHYSQSHHDYKHFDNGNMIDGGRAYIRTTNGCDIYKVFNGKLVPGEWEELQDWMDSKEKV